MIKWIVHVKSGLHFDIYCGRPTIYGNPWSHKEQSLANFGVETTVDAVDNYEKWLEGTAYQDVLQDQRLEILQNLPFLKNKILACWCADGRPCHSRVLFKKANGFYPETQVVDKLLFD